VQSTRTAHYVITHYFKTAHGYGESTSKYKSGLLIENIVINYIGNFVPPRKKNSKRLIVDTYSGGVKCSITSDDTDYHLNKSQNNDKTIFSMVFYRCI